MKNKRQFLREGYGSGFSFTGGRIGGMGGTSRSGFGGAGNLGGPNMMYTYEIKPLNHSLEQKPNMTANSQIVQIQIGSKISGEPIRSNATPNKKIIKGIIQKIVKTNDNSIKYYIIRDETTQEQVKIDPLTVKLIIHEPIEYYNDNTDNIPSRRKQKIKAVITESKLVPESLKESLNEQIINNRLNIFFNKDDSYDAIRNFILYNFYWNPGTYKIYNFKKIGTISNKYSIAGKLINKPHIQMILQVQRNINDFKSLKESSLDLN